ncbi:adenylyl-sulfate kinase [Aureimonas sp. ME7]|uniref:adenylyl-sulfate kinase n=1 Tax=Aureimonas sp. ME7 TaxID=2744252 RepID=UPI0015F488A0|nr:adenylyl-sulfate kinase [Aureimonas sp. ME7]
MRQAGSAEPTAYPARSVSRVLVYGAPDVSRLASALHASASDGTEPEGVQSEALPSDLLMVNASEPTAGGASLAVLFVDADDGFTPQARQDAFRATLRGVRHLVLAVDRLDRQDGEPGDRLGALTRAFAEGTRFLELASLRAAPVASRTGETVDMARSPLPFHDKPSLIDLLRDLSRDGGETAPQPFRMIVQGSNSESADLFGTLAGGTAAPGDEVVLAATGARARIAALASPPDAGTTGGDAIGLRLDRPLAATAGDILAAAADRPQVCDQFAGHVAWSGDEPLLPGRAYLLESMGRRTPASVTRIKHKLSLEDGTPLAAGTLAHGDIGQVNLSLAEAIAFEPFERNRTLATFRLIDPASDRDVAAGRIDFALRRAANIHRQAVDVTKAARAEAKNQRPVLLWFTGLSGAGKSTLANLVERRLFALGHHTYLLDGDNVRHGLNRDLGFTAPDRVENIRRVAETAKLMVDAGLVTLASFISPFRAERQLARDLLGAGEFVEIFVDAPLAVAEERDPKGLYAQARAGKIPNFTGIDSPYEAPEAPEIHLRTDQRSAEDLADEVVDHLHRNGFLAGDILSG